MHPSEVGLGMRGKKMTVKVPVCIRGNDGTIPRWGM
jgi:hypothetical protein